jgi:hypothetical protein
MCDAQAQYNYNSALRRQPRRHVVDVGSRDGGTGSGTGGIGGTGSGTMETPRGGPAGTGSMGTDAIEPPRGGAGGTGSTDSGSESMGTG